MAGAIIGDGELAVQQTCRQAEPARISAKLIGSYFNGIHGLSISIRYHQVGRKIGQDGGFAGLVVAIDHNAFEVYHLARAVDGAISEQEGAFHLRRYIIVATIVVYVIVIVCV